MVNEILEKPHGKHGAYLALTPAQKFLVGKRAAQSGVTAIICYYVKMFLDIPLKEISVERMKNDYLSHLKTPEKTMMYRNYWARNKADLYFWVSNLTSK